jgi:pterin-4a-carbinolamine dehydratase
VLDGWLCRTYQVKSYSRGALLTAAIAHLAEGAGHHPDVTLRYGNVTVRLRTHTAQAITSKDFALAAQIERMADSPAS